MKEVRCQSCNKKLGEISPGAKLETICPRCKAKVSYQDRLELVKK